MGWRGGAVEGAGEMVGEHHRVEAEDATVAVGSKNNQRLLAPVRSMRRG
jgi:hypothetical protein